MASLSPKGSDSKKTVGTKTILSPSNSANKTSLLKSPPSKLSARLPSSAGLKAVSESVAATGKSLFGAKSRVDASPPKVARSPSSKSLSPPNKVTVKGPAASSSSRTPVLDKTHSNGDISVPLKNGITGLVEENGICDVIIGNAESNEFNAATPLTENTAEKQVESATTTESAAILNGNESFHSAHSETMTSEQNVDEMQAAVTSEQKHASGDQVSEEEAAAAEEKTTTTTTTTPENDKIELTGVSGEGAAAAAAAVVATSVEAEVEPSDNTVTSDEPQKPDEQNVVDDLQKLNIEDDNAKEEIESHDSSTPRKSANSSATDCTECTVELAQLEADKAEEEENKVPETPPEISKQSFRHKVYTKLEENNLVLFPRPCTDRIPNFVNAPAAAEKLSQWSVFKQSKTVKVNPDKPQEFVRFHTLEYGKRLLVPSPRLRDGLFLEVKPPAEANKQQLQQTCQRFGMKKWGKQVNLEDKVTIDLIVLGSVAVDKKGHRIGKGEGFADLEFAMLMKMNAVNENTVIVTTVHDEQVFDELPDEIFKEFDVPVDWIITPTQVIEVAEKLPRPKGIIWSILSNRRILEIPILQKLREQEQSEGLECTLKEVDSDVEERPSELKSVFPKRYTRRRRFYFMSTGDPIRDSKLPPPMHPSYYGGGGGGGGNRGPRRFSPNHHQQLSSSYNHHQQQQQPSLQHHGGGGPRIYDAPSPASGGLPPMQHQQPRRNYYVPPPPQGVPGAYGSPINRGMRQSRSRGFGGGPQQQSRSMPGEGGYPPPPPQMQQHGGYQGRMGPRPRHMNRGGGGNNGSGLQNGMHVPPHTNRGGSGRNSNRSFNSNTMTKSVEVQTIDKDSRPIRQYVKRKRAPIEFSLRVKNIGTGVRVRDLKSALNERGIKPRDITWRGYRGFAFLHFVKTAPKENNQPALSVEDVIGALQGLPLPPKNKKTLVIEPAKPKKLSITEEEEADVTFDVGKKYDAETKLVDIGNTTVTIENVMSAPITV